MLFVAVAWLAAEALITLLVAAAALILTLAGWRPSPAPVPPLELLQVVELRCLARAAGLPRLARFGRRVELLQALAVRDHLNGFGLALTELLTA